jgi:cell wall-associated NlpC family hydrolase
MPRSKNARHAKPTYPPRHARPSQAPARVAAVTAAGGLLFPVVNATSAYAGVQQSSTVRVSGPGAPVPPGSAPAAMRLISDGHYVSGQPVEIQIPEGSGWRTIGKGSTNSEGLARTSVSVARDTRIRAYYRGATTTAPATSSSVVIDVETFGQRVVAEAARHNGKPYQYGATGPNAFDCSGFTRYVHGRLGRSLPHSAAAQRDMAQPIARANARVGDLVFMDGNGHVGIYAGNGMMWDAPKAGRTVTKRAIYTSTYAVGRIA